MRVDVHLLPGSALSVQSFSARGEAPYLDAHEEMRAAVVDAIGGMDIEPEWPYRRCAVTIVCYVGRNRSSHRYRPQRVHTLHYVLDPIYRAIMDAGVISTLKSIYSIRVALVRDSGAEGFRIVVDELPPGTPRAESVS